MLYVCCVLYIIDPYKSMNIVTNLCPNMSHCSNKLWKLGQWSLKIYTDHNGTYLLFSKEGCYVFKRTWVYESCQQMPSMQIIRQHLSDILLISLPSAINCWWKNRMRVIMLMSQQPVFCMQALLDISFCMCLGYGGRRRRRGEGQRKFAYGNISMFVKQHCHNEVFKDIIVGSESNTFWWLLAIAYTKLLSSRVCGSKLHFFSIDILIAISKIIFVNEELWILSNRLNLIPCLIFCVQARDMREKMFP